MNWLLFILFSIIGSVPVFIIIQIWMLCFGSMAGSLVPEREDLKQAYPDIDEIGLKALVLHNRKQLVLGAVVSVLLSAFLVYNVMASGYLFRL